MTEADTFDWLPALLVLQGLSGAVDTLLNHEVLEKLARRREARVGSVRDFLASRRFPASARV